MSNRRRGCRVKFVSFINRASGVEVLEGDGIISGGGGDGGGGLGGGGTGMSSLR
jgi:hypothetical protein